MYSRSKWQTLIAPAASALYPPDFTAMLPDLFAQTNFIQLKIEDSLLRSWLKLPRAFRHTDLYLFRKDTKDSDAVCSLWTHAPPKEKPWGVDLPSPDCVCSCATWQREQPIWKHKFTRSSLVAGEVYCFFATSCCAYELHLGVFTGSRKLLPRHGTQLLKSEIDSEGNKVFNHSTMTAMQLRVRLLVQHPMLHRLIAIMVAVNNTRVPSAARQCMD
jgi:hypothetical protein